MTTSLKENQFYNLVLRKRVTVSNKSDIGVDMLRNGTPCLKSYHSSSKVLMIKFIPKKSYEKMLKKYGKF